MKPAALLCFAPALAAGARGPDRDFQRGVDASPDSSLARASGPGVFAWFTV